MSIERLTHKNSVVVLTDKDVSKTIKPNFKVDLFPNQLLYANFFREFELNNLDIFKSKKRTHKYTICINDPIASGKSYAILGFLSLVKESDKENNVTTHLVVSYKLIKQWVGYLNNTDLKYFIVNSSKTYTEYSIKESEYNLVLFSSTFYHLNKFNPIRVIVDDFHNMEVKKYPEFYFFYIERVYFLNSRLKKICCIEEEDALVELVNYKTDKKSVLDEIKFEIIKKYYNYSNSKYLSILEDVDVDIIKNIDNTCDSSPEFVKSILKELLEQCKDLTSTLKNKEQFLVKTKNLTNTNIIMKKKNIEDTKLEIKEIKQKLKDVKSKIYDIKNRILSDECLVCLSEIKTKKIILNCCNVAICNDCSNQLRNCIYCKKTLDDDGGYDYWARIKLLENMKFNKNAKVLILGYDYEFKINRIEKIVNKWFPGESEILQLEGNSSTCEKKFNLFKNDKTKHVLYFAYEPPFIHDICGINLEFATDIVAIPGEKNSQMEQIIGRAFRYGRTDNLNVHFLKLITRVYTYKQNQ